MDANSVHRLHAANNLLTVGARICKDSPRVIEVETGLGRTLKQELVIVKPSVFGFELRVFAFEIAAASGAPELLTKLGALCSGVPAKALRVHGEHAEHVIFAARSVEARLRKQLIQPVSDDFAARGVARKALAAEPMLDGGLVGT